MDKIIIYLYSTQTMTNAPELTCEMFQCFNASTPTIYNIVFIRSYI